MKAFYIAFLIFGLAAGNSTICAAQDSDPAPSGTTTTEVYVGPNSTITMPGPDAGVVNGNHVDFDTPGAVPEGSPYSANPDNTAIIHGDPPSDE